jgi:hypothetical protein
MAGTDPIEPAAIAGELAEIGSQLAAVARGAEVFIAAMAERGRQPRNLPDLRLVR